MPTESLLSLAAAGTIALSGGGTGLLSVPDAHLLPLNSFEYQHNNGVIPTNDPRALSLERAVNDHVQFAVVPGLEFGARLTTWYDETTGQRVVNDLSPHVKLQLYQGQQISLAVGARDFAGEGFKKLVPAYFGVGTWRYKQLSATVGFGTADEEGVALDGVFGGLRYSPTGWLDLMADHDAAESQIGLQLHHRWTGGQVYLKGYYSSFEAEDVVYAAGLRLNLGQDAAAARMQLAPDLAKLAPVHLQLRLEPALRYAVGSEFGRADYAVALRSSAQLLLPLGLSVYAAWDTPALESDDYEVDGRFARSAFESGLFEQAVQVTVAPVKGLHLQAQLGRTLISEEMVDFRRGEAALALFGGRAAVSGSVTRFDAPRFVEISESQTLGKAFVWLYKARYAAQLTAGDFQYGDDGARLDLFAYLGATRLGVYLKDGDEQQAMGMTLSIPLGTREGLRSQYVSLNGTPHFQPSLETQINSDDERNELRPNFLREFVPQRDLIDDVLDQWRVTPYYTSNR